MAINPERIPADIVRHIVQHLDSRKHLYRCVLVNRLFHAATIPFLWELLDMRMKPWARSRLLHPTTILLYRSHYGKYIIEIREDTSWTHMGRSMLQERLNALQLCTNLRTFSWTDSSTLAENDDAFLAHLDILQRLRITELTVKLSSGISPVVWKRLMQLKGLASFSLSSSQCVLDDISAWADASSHTLRHLEFSITSEADRYPTFITRLTHLHTLRLDAPSSIIPSLLLCLPHLTTLDIRYRLSDKIPAPHHSRPPAARLRDLTVHVVHERTKEVWTWLSQLVPHVGTLETLTIHSRARPGGGGSFLVERAFLQWLAQVHGASIRKLLLFNLHIAPEDVEFVCKAFPRLEALSFAPDGSENLLQLMDCIVPSARSLKSLTIHSSLPMSHAFEHARRWMSRSANSQLLSVTIGTEAFTGKWVRKTCASGASKLLFEVSRQHNLPDRWM